jgi:hypothetical protein
MWTTGRIQYERQMNVDTRARSYRARGIRVHPELVSIRTSLIVDRGVARVLDGGERRGLAGGMRRITALSDLREPGGAGAGAPTVA